MSTGVRAPGRRREVGTREPGDLPSAVVIRERCRSGCIGGKRTNHPVWMCGTCQFAVTCRRRVARNASRVSPKHRRRRVSVARRERVGAVRANSRHAATSAARGFTITTNRWHGAADDQSHRCACQKAGRGAEIGAGDARAGPNQAAVALRYRRAQRRRRAAGCAKHGEPDDGDGSGPQQPSSYAAWRNPRSGARSGGG